MAFWLRFGCFSDIRFRFHRSRQQRLWLRYESNISHDFASFACGAHFNHKYLSVSAKRNHRSEDAGLREKRPVPRVFLKRPSSIDISCAIRCFRLRHLLDIRLPACLEDRFLLKPSSLILGWVCCSLTR